MDGTAFNRLEERVEALLNRLMALKEENHQLNEQLRQSERSVAELSQLKASLEQERQEVKQRVRRVGCQAGVNFQRARDTMGPATSRGNATKVVACEGFSSDMLWLGQSGWRSRWRRVCREMRRWKKSGWKYWAESMFFVPGLAPTEFSWVTHYFQQQVEQALQSCNPSTIHGSHCSGSPEHNQRTAAT